MKNEANDELFPLDSFINPKSKVELSDTQSKI